jgi:hypothetical protein
MGLDMTSGKGGAGGGEGGEGTVSASELPSAMKGAVALLASTVR